LQDRERPDTEDKQVRGVPFEARFARDVAEFKPRLEDLPGVDGFVWLVDALYQVGSGQQWFLQVRQIGAKFASVNIICQTVIVI
jgi:hypothetical protein